ncbi:hypothetical protein N8596_00915, partial [bacterium]|nr:hypothetical protein [bacterium]
IVPSGIGTPENPVISIAAGSSMTVVATAPCEGLQATFGDAIDVPGEVSSLRLAINLACDGTTIRLAPGTYSNNIHLPIDFQGKAITIEGDPANPGEAVLDGTGLETSVVRMVSGEGSDSILRGVTIRNGSVGSEFGGITVGGGLHTLETSPVIEDCVFESNTAPYGGAVYARQGAPVFRRCVFTGNEATVDGGAFHFSRTEGGVLEDSVFEGNAAGNNGGAVHLFGGTPTITGAVMTENTALNGGGVSWSSTGFAASFSDSSITANTASFGGGVWIAGDTPDLTITGTSVCDNSPDEIAGVYTDGGGNVICPSVDCNENGIEDADEIADGSAADCNGNDIIDSCEIADGSAADINLDGILDECQETLKFSVPDGFGTIAEAIDAAPDGSIISLAAGTYNEAVDFGSKNLVLQGDASHPPSVVLDGTGLETSVVSIVDGQDSSSMVIGLTIANGSIGSPLPGQPTSRIGGGLFVNNASPLVQDCIFESNTSGFGGAVYLRYGAPSITNCEFMGNSATTDGGAMFVFGSNAVIETCSMVGNDAVNHGGGIKVVLGEARIVATVVSENTAFEGGGIYWFANEDTVPLRIEGCEVRGNEALKAGGGIKSRGGFPGVDLIDTTVCDNAPEEIAGDFIDGGGNDICPNVDCNENGIEDADEIADGAAEDCNGNGIIDSCEIADESA